MSRYDSDLGITHVWYFEFVWEQQASKEFHPAGQRRYRERGDHSDIGICRIYVCGTLRSGTKVEHGLNRKKTSQTVESSPSIGLSHFLYLFAAHFIPNSHQCRLFATTGWSLPPCSSPQLLLSKSLPPQRQSSPLESVSKAPSPLSQINLLLPTSLSTLLQRNPWKHQSSTTTVSSALAILWRASSKISRTRYLSFLTTIIYHSTHRHQSRHATPSRSPTNETCNNPFTKLTRFATSPENLPVKKHQTTHPETQSTARLRRKQYRSSSRRATLSTTPNTTPGQASSGDEPKIWHMESNPRGNGGLKNAVDSVEDRIRKKLWIGTLGTCTDDFGEDLRKDINSRMLTQRSSVPVWIPDAEFESFYDEFCHQVSWFSFLSRVSVGNSRSLIRFFGLVYIMQSPTRPKPNCSTNQHLTNNMSLSINVSQTSSSTTIKRVTWVCLFYLLFILTT